MAAGNVHKIILFCLLFNPVVARAELNVERARLEPLAMAKELALHAEPLPLTEFIDAALVFSGLTPEEAPAYRQKTDAVIAETKAAFAGREMNRAAADDLLQFLHQRYLKQYQFLETGMPRLLDEGRFNCVSSSLLYLMAAEALGIEAVGVRTKDHAFIKVTIGGVAYDVESTSRYGFDPGKKKEFINEFGKTTGFVYSPPTAYRDRQDIGRKELLSLVLNNRIAQALEAGQFDAATGPGADLFELLKNEETLKLLLGIFSGLAQLALDTGQYRAGYEILNRAVIQYRDFNQVQDLRRFFIADWSNQLITKKQFAEAQAIAKREYAQGKISADDYRKIMLYRYQSEADALSRNPQAGPEAALALIDEAKQELGDEAALLKAEGMYAYNRVISLIEKGKFEEAAQSLERFAAEKKIGRPEAGKLIIYYTQKKAQAMGENYRAALSAVEEGLAEIGDEPALLKSAAIYSYNLSIRLIKTESFEEAASFLAGEQAKKYLTEAGRTELRLFLFIGRAEKAKKAKDYPSAIAVIEEGLTLLGRKPELLRHYEILIHNHMIEFYDKKEYDRAETAIQNGLAVYPSSVLLKGDLEKIKKMQKR